MNMDNYFAWCIVPFDSENRTPEERISMLNELGFKAYAYDWREEHLATMATELDLAKENNIDITSIWMWLSENDSVGGLNSLNERLLKIVDESGIQTQLWVSFPDSYFDDLADEDALNKAVSMIDYVAGRAELAGWSIGLYTHGGWFGDPENLVRIVKALPSKELGIIFNFHHAHESLDQYEQQVEVMLPYLHAVNLNGMKAEGPKILPIGAGELESEMISLLEEKGYKGHWGILGHVEDRDVEIVLRENLEGLKTIL